LSIEIINTMDKENELNEPKPIGSGALGNIYDQFKGKAKEAFDFLVAHEDGDLLGVFYREGFGEIDLVWGNEYGGLKHILIKHVGEKKSFATIEDAVFEIKSIIDFGEIVFENVDKGVFQKGNKIVTVRKNFREKGKKIADKNWVLTAYDETTADGGSAITTSN